MTLAQLQVLGGLMTQQGPEAPMTHAQAQAQVQVRGQGPGGMMHHAQVQGPAAVVTQAQLQQRLLAPWRHPLV